jgi:hypothetical protein
LWVWQLRKDELLRTSTAGHIGHGCMAWRLGSYVGCLVSDKLELCKVITSDIACTYHFELYTPILYLLPYVRKQVIASSSKSSRRLRRRGRMRCSSCSCCRRSAAPTTKVIVLSNCRCTPTRTLRRGMCGSRCHGWLTWRRRSPHIVATPCIHV